MHVQGTEATLLRILQRMPCTDIVLYIPRVTPVEQVAPQIVVVYAK